MSAVITCSRFLAGQVSDELGVSAERVYPCHLAVDHEVFHPIGPGSPIEDPYFLHVSTGGAGRKNTARVLAAHARLHANGTPATRFVRDPGFRGADNAIALNEHLSTESLARWYRGALGLVFPSLYEGFGLPILEAMACGTPVITANSTACAEVADDAALLVDPRSTESIAGAMDWLRRDPALRRQLRERGLERARDFTWARTAATHLRVFAEAATESG